MDNVMIPHVLTSFSDFLNLLFVVYCMYNKWWSWIFLLVSQAELFIYNTLVMQYFDVTTLSLSLMSVAALYHRKNTIYKHMPSAYYVIVLFMAISAFLSMTYMDPNLSIDKAVYSSLTISGIALLTAKCTDGWYILCIASAFYLTSSLVNTIVLVVLSCALYTIGVKLWDEERKNQNDNKKSV